MAYRTIPTVLSDNRLREGFEHETNDCTVRALKFVLGVPYRDAHNWLQKRGRIDRRGCWINNFLEQCDDTKELIFGMRVKTIFRANLRSNMKTVASLRFRLMSGKYLLLKSGHAFAIIDGQGYDMGYVSSLWKVYRIYQFQNSSVVEPKERQGEVNIWQTL